jgi:hypothetical protein
MKNNTSCFVKNIASTVLYKRTVYAEELRNSEQKAHHWAKRKYENISCK